MIEKKSRKRRPKVNYFQDDEKHWFPIMDYTITIQSFNILSDEKHKIIDVPSLSLGNSLSRFDTTP